MNFLNDEERARLRTQHKQERDGRIRDRIKAILLYDRGWSPKQIADALLISDEAVRAHIEDYKTSKKLRPESGGSQEKLTDKQSRQLEGHLQGHTYLYVKDIVAYAKVYFGVEYSVHGMRNWLQRHGFSYKKPAIVPGKVNEQKQKEWIAEYEKLRAELPTNETICFIIERLWKWMKERVIYNTYYPEFDEFKSAILGFFSLISSLTSESELGQCFRNRVRDKFRPISAPATNF